MFRFRLPKSRRSMSSVIRAARFAQRGGAGRDTANRSGKTYTVAQGPRRGKKLPGSNHLDVQTEARCGVRPTFDVKRHALYIGTGDAYNPRQRPLQMPSWLWTWLPGRFCGRIKTQRRCVLCGLRVAKFRGECPKDLGPDYDLRVTGFAESAGGTQIPCGRRRAGCVGGTIPARRELSCGKPACREAGAGMITFAARRTIKAPILD